MDPYQPHDDRDFDNPYAPPQSSFARETVPELQAGMSFTVADVFNWSWAIFKERMGLCMGFYWGTFGLNMGIGLGMNLLLQGLGATVRDPLLLGASYVVIQISSILIQVWLGIGQARAYLKIARAEPVAFEEIFKGGRYVLTTILASIIFIIILGGPIGIAAVVGAMGMAAMGERSAGGIIVFLVASMLASVFVIYVSSRLLLYYYIIVDRNAGVIDSLQQTWRLCRGRVGTIILVLFVQFAIILAGVLALCVGLVWAAPLASMLYPVTYLAMTGTRTSQQPGKPEFVWEEDV